MMSALLRHAAARRLCGSMVQRAQAAVVEERRRLGPRLMHTDESLRKEVMLDIQQKKEELFDVISWAEKEYMITNWSNRRLIQDLSVQVTPRPYDSNWRRLRIVKTVSSLAETAGLISLSGILGIMIYLEWPGAAKEKADHPVLTSKGSEDNI